MLFIHIEEVLKSFGVTNYTIVGEPLSENDLFEKIKIVVGEDSTGTVVYEEHLTNYPFTFNQFKEKLQEIKQEFADNEYQRFRAKEYPSIKEQLDMLWHAIDKGTLNKTSDFYISLKSVKDQFPKT